MSGTWSPSEDKVRAGFYMRFISAALARINGGERGVVTVPVKANWGPVEQVVDIESQKDLQDKFHTDDSEEFTAYKLIRLILLGEPSKVMAYRLVDGSEKVSSLTLKDNAATPADMITLSSAYPSTRPFNVTVRDNVVDPSNKQDIVLYEGTKQLYVFTVDRGSADDMVESINNDKDNMWITASKTNDGNGELTTIANADLTGGNAGTSGVTNEDYTDAMAAFETREFNAFALGAADEALQTSVRSWVSRLRDEGKKVIAYMGGSTTDDEDPNAGDTRSIGFNHEGVVNVTVSGKLDGVWHPSAEVACYVAGLASGQSLRESTTFAATPFEDVSPRLKNSQIKKAIQSGSFVMTHDGERVICERGVNTLTSLGEGQDNSWKKLKIIRIRDAIATDTTKTARDSYIGKVLNNADGQAALLSALKNYFETLSPELIAEGFVVEADEELNANAEADQFFWKYSAKEIDSMEEIYGTGHVG
ncbi:phage tail sheath protein [Halobacillus trueperi]|uniref:Phage tail sheath protein n=1 Tax=Halobacillus trueperi TaxID=156205 RepID=A0A3D8VLY8_9BACI|nr:phage tail sheath family protein [Halobacillus trueperi]RDY70322.1 phage tail sheath protein [Halobacillus trueperi]